MDVVTILGSIIRTVWDMLVAIPIPGTPLTALHVIVAPFGFVVFTSVFKMITGAGNIDTNALKSINFDRLFSHRERPHTRWVGTVESPMITGSSTPSLTQDD